MPRTEPVQYKSNVNAELLHMERQIYDAWEKSAIEFADICSLVHDAHSLLTGVSNCHGDTTNVTEADLTRRFKRWVDEHCPFDWRTAYRILAAHDVLQSKCLKRLENKQLALIDRTVLYDLGKNGTPQSVVELVAEKAGKNERVTRKDLKAKAKQVKRRAAGRKKEKPEPLPEEPPDDEDTVEAVATVEVPEEDAPAHETHDGTGKELPENLVAVFDTGMELRGIAKRLRAERLALAKLLVPKPTVLKGVPQDQQESSIPGAEAVPNSIVKLLDEVVGAIKGNVPHVICPTCKGAGCAKQERTKVFCGGRGWLTVDGSKSVTDKLRA